MRLPSQITRPHRISFTLAALLFFFLGWITWRFLFEGEPAYQGKTLSQ